MNFDLLAPNAPSRDHVVPRSRLKNMVVTEAFLGSNIRLAHRFCNSHRGDRAVDPNNRDEYVNRLAEALEEYELEREYLQEQIEEIVEQ